MALRNIVTEGDEVLRKKSREVAAIDDRILTLLDDMIETMRHQEGVGIAAPQVGVLKRIFVVEVDGVLYELINPEIIETKGSIIEDEACLSVPAVVGVVERPTYVKIKGLNRKGEEVVYEGTELLAKAFCHENDHLDGILFIDKALEIHEME